MQDCGQRPPMLKWVQHTGKVFTPQGDQWNVIAANASVGSHDHYWIMVGSSLLSLHSTRSFDRHNFISRFHPRSLSMADITTFAAPQLLYKSSKMSQNQTPTCLGSRHPPEVRTPPGEFHLLLLDDSHQRRRGRNLTLIGCRGIVGRDFFFFQLQVIAWGVRTASPEVTPYVIVSVHWLCRCSRGICRVGHFRCEHTFSLPRGSDRQTLTDTHISKCPIIGWGCVKFKRVF